jgi:hypothetical protein
MQFESAQHLLSASLKVEARYTAARHEAPLQKEGRTGPLPLCVLEHNTPYDATATVGDRMRESRRSLRTLGGRLLPKPLQSDPNAAAASKDLCTTRRMT